MSRIVLACGANGNGQLGLGRSDVTVVSEFAPVPLPPSEEVLCAAAGGYHSLVVMKAGRVYSWGMNKNGQAGHSTETVTALSTPQRLRVPAPPGFPSSHRTKDGDMRIIGAEAGESHTLLLVSNGEVLSFGCNAVGQLGRPSTHSNHHLAIAVDFSGALGTLARGAISIAQIFCGPNTSFAITSQGQLLGWGGSSNSELGFQQAIVPAPKLISIGLPPSVQVPFKIAKVAAGPSHTLLLTTTGEVFVAGDNGDGQLGVGGAHAPTWRAIRHARHIREIATNAHQSFLLTPMGLLSECGTSISAGNEERTLMASPDIIYELKGVECRGVTAAGSCVIAWTGTGDLWCRGVNHRGQLGLGHLTPATHFTKVQRGRLAGVEAERVPVSVRLGRAHALAVFGPAEPQAGLISMVPEEEDEVAQEGNVNLMSRSCADDVMNLSFSRSKPPTLSFAAANRSVNSHAGASKTAEGGQAPFSWKSLAAPVVFMGMTAVLATVAARALRTRHT